MKTDVERSTRPFASAARSLLAERWRRACRRVARWFGLARTDIGIAALHAAATAADVELVERLLGAGADPSVQSDHGWTPLEYSRRFGGGPYRDVERALRQAGPLCMRPGLLRSQYPREAIEDVHGG